MFSIQSFLTWASLLLMTYKHLSQAERYQIHALMKAGHYQSLNRPGFCRHLIASFLMTKRGIYEHPEAIPRRIQD